MIKNCINHKIRMTEVPNKKNVSPNKKYDMLNMMHHIKLTKFDSFNVKENPSDKQPGVLPFSLTKKRISQVENPQ